MAIPESSEEVCCDVGILRLHHETHYGSDSYSFAIIVCHASSPLSVSCELAIIVVICNPLSLHEEIQHGSGVSLSWNPFWKHIL